MAKNDRLKEELAEHRHNEVTGLMLGALGFAGISLTIAFEVWLSGTSSFVALVAWQKVLSLLPVPLIVVTLIWAASRIMRLNECRRKGKIKQLDNKP